MSTIRVQTPPAQEPITLDALKQHLYVTITNDDDLLTTYLQMARELVESESGRSLVNKVYRQSHDRFPHLHNWTDYGTGYYYGAPTYSRGHNRRDWNHAIKLLRSPLIVGSSRIVYIGQDGNLYTMVPGPSSPGDPYQVPESWSPETDRELGEIFLDSNGNEQQVTAVTESETGGESKSGAEEPTWNQSLGGQTTDGDLTCTNIGPPPQTNGGNFIEDSDSEPARLVPQYGQFWPLTLRVPNAVQVFFTAGYGNDAASAPASLKVAMMQAVAACYENREAMTAEQLRKFGWYDNLIWSERVLDYSPTP